MRLLLDTHALIWHYEANAALSEEARKLIDAPDSQLFISVASLWELVIKLGLGKLTLRKDVQAIVNLYQDAGARLLPVNLEHVLAVQTLPWHHRDPFDRLLVAQALQEDLVLISNDHKLNDYPVPRRW